MQTKHTPGPWAAEPQLTPDGRMGDAWNIVADDWPAVPVAEVRREADALLIAAAPKLVRALRLIAEAEPMDGDTIVCDFDTLQGLAADVLREAGL